jgi:ADP-heptose:LPS heptosyltransferase
MNASPFTAPPRRIGVFRALQLGDLLCAVPAWRAMRAAYPEARVTLIGLPWAEEFVRRFDRYLDDFIAFPGYPGLPEQDPDLDRLPAFFADVQRRRLDLLVQMHGCGTYVNDLALLCGAGATAGYYAPPQPNPAQDFFMRYPDGLPEIHRHLRLMEFLGIPSQGDHLEFPLTDQDRAGCDRLARESGLTPDRAVCVHPGGRGLDRRWPIERFAEVVEVLSAQGWTVLVTGTAAERSLAEHIRRLVPRPPIDLTGKTTLGSLTALLSRARLLVANDTGVSHVASAVGCRSVIVCVGSDPVRWGPLNRDRHRLLVGADTRVDDVLAEVRIQLESAGRPGDQSAQKTVPTPVVAPTRFDHPRRPLRVLTWHVHGNYLYYLTQAPHEWYLPVGLDRPGYAGAAPGFPWSERVHDVPVDRLRRTAFDCILFQHRRHYCEDQYELLSNEQRRLPRIYLEHDPPQDHPTDQPHVVDDPEMLLVHVTPFNRLMWDGGRTPTRVIEHGIPSHRGVRYTGELARGLVVINELPRRGRRVGADVFEAVRRIVPLDLIGMKSEEAGGLGEVSHAELPAFMARYRFFFNPIRYTSLGLAVCEAMHLGMPIVALATTEMATAVSDGVSGYLDTDVDRLVQRMAFLLASPEEAKRLGEGARRTAEARFGLERFVADWDRTLQEHVARRASPPARRNAGVPRPGDVACAA